jgi:hypothetical protein
MTVYTTDDLKIGTYILKLYGYISGYNSVNAYVEFDLVLDNYCYYCTIDSQSISDLTYDINSLSVITLAFLNWTVTNFLYSPYTDVCSAITYTLINQDLSSADTSVINIDGNNYVEVYTIDSSKVGILNLRIVGSIGSYVTAYEDFIITITNVCASTSITPATVSNKNYNIYDSVLTISVNNFTSADSCGDFKYTITCNGTICPSFITYDEVAMKIYIYSTTLSDSGIYSIGIVGTLY